MWWAFRFRDPAETDCEQTWRQTMVGIYLMGGIIAAGILIYLVGALLYPEKFS